MTSHDRWLVAWQERDALLRIARPRVATREDAEDVVAEAIRRAGMQHDLPVEAVPAWLTRVTMNLCVDRQRRLATQRKLLTRAELRVEAEPSHEETIADRAEARWLADAVEGLPARQAQVLRLRAAGLDNPSIARHLGLTVAAVEGLLKRSRTMLRQVLRAAGALLGVVSVRRSLGTRSAPVLATAGLAILLLLLPGTSAPKAPGGSEDRGPSTRTQTGSVEASALLAPGRPATRAGDTFAAPALVGQAPPYDGPHCLATYCLPIVDDTADETLGSARPQGWSPHDLQDYLGEPAWAASAAKRAPLVAVVSSFQFDWTANDLDTYRATFHLPPCTEDTHCLSFVDPPDTDEQETLGLSLVTGAASTASARTGGTVSMWAHAMQQAQLLQGVSAACPECRLMLVRAASDGIDNLAAAFRAAGASGADVVVSDLQDALLIGDVLSDPRTYRGSLLVNAGGNTGYRPGQVPAPLALPEVIGVGGTVVDGNRIAVNSDTRSYCNLDGRRPEWQDRMDTGCPGRAGVDLAAPSGSDTGLAVYLSGGLPGGRGWYHPGGNVQAASIFGGLLARHNLTSVVHGPQDLYSHPEWFTDIVAGNSACTVENACNDAAPDTDGCLPGAPQICYARRGWDGPTGLGEPRHLPWL